MAAKEQTRFKVEVTEADIEKAQRNNSYRCVVAQAIARTVPDATRIEVDTQAIRFTRAETGQRFLYLTPPVAVGYVVAFDAGEPPEPFRFTLTHPMEIGRRVRTEAGKAADKARDKAKRKASKDALVHPAESTSSSEPAAEVSETAPEMIVEPPVSEEAAAEAMKEAYVAAKEDYAGEKLQVSNGGGRIKNPRVYKTGKRVYGSRILRVNRRRDAEVS